MEKYDPHSLPDLLPIYYKRFFPYGPYFKWLNYGGVPKTYFSHREFSFTLKDDVYIRYQSFGDQQELEKEMQKMCPYKIDIGAVFSHRPREHKMVKAASFHAQEKELVFDIDMTDYDDVRVCCSGADICPKCWPLMIIAVKIMDRALREDFGYKHLLFVYSGRRGIHCWVCDEHARKLSQNARIAIAEYLSVVKGGENQIKKVSIGDKAMHPSIQSAFDIIEMEFEDYAVKQQGFLDSEEQVKSVLALIPNEELREKILKDFDKVGDQFQTTRHRWKLLKHGIREANQQKCSQCTAEIMLQYAYPRLDVNVSKGINHLLKSPFSVHPKTGRVCVPFDPDDVENFDPFTVPTISQLCDELNEVDKSDDDMKRKIKDYRLTSMKASMEVFDTFVQNLETSWRGKLIQQSDMKKDF